VVCNKRHRIAKGILTITLIWIFSGCAYQQPSLKPAPEELPSAVEIKPETTVSKPLAPVAPESEADVIAPKTSDLKKPTPESRVFLHKVRWPEETLSRIAKWYTGTVRNWKAIAKINPELDPRDIDIGDTISIPEDLMISHKPMPHSFVKPAVHKNSTPRSLTNKTATQSESSKLFGPIVSKPSKTETDSVKLFGPVETQQPSIEPDTDKLFGPIE
jgi:LysM repeat protein